MIPTTVPSSVRRPGAFHEFKFVQSGGLFNTVNLRVLIVAEKTAAGTAAADTPVQAFDELDADAKAGVGSFAALLARKAFEQAKLGGLGAPEIWMCPVAENAGGTAAIFTATVTGPATAGGDLIVSVAGRLLSVGVTAGDTATTIAAAIKAKADELAATLPVTASVALGVVTFTARTKGVNGNDIARSNVQLPAGVAIVHATPTPGAGATAITNAINATYDRRYHAVVLANHVTGDAAVVQADISLARSYNQKNYRFYFVGETGSLGTASTLAAAYNDYGLLVISCEACPALPGELAAVAAIAEFSRELPNANTDGERLALPPPPAASAYTAPEVESALAAGVTPLTPDGAFVKIERLVTSQITVASAPFEALRDIAYPRTSFALAEDIDAGFLAGFRQEVLDDDPDGDIKARVRDMVISVHRNYQKRRILRDVEDFIDQIQVEEAVAPAGRLVVSDPHRPAGPLHQGVFVHTMYLGAAA